MSHTLRNLVTRLRPGRPAIRRRRSLYALKPGTIGMPQRLEERVMLSVFTVTNTLDDPAPARFGGRSTR